MTTPSVSDSVAAPESTCPASRAGLIPSEEWVERVYHHKWYAGETISVAIGQGSVTVTPIQLARMIAAVASGGTLVQPHLLKDLPTVKQTRFPAFR